MFKRPATVIFLTAAVLLVVVQLYTWRDLTTLVSLDYWKSWFRYGQVMRLAATHHVDFKDISFEDFTDQALRAGMRSLDANSDYFAPDAFADFEMSSRREYFGIGVQLRDVNERLLVLQVFDDSPAEAAGFRAGDILVAVDGEPIDGMEIEAVVRLIRGIAGTTVEIEVERPPHAERVVIPVERGAIQLRSVVDVEVDDDGIAYLRLSQFTATMATELREVLEELEAGGARALVVDLRENPGGVLGTVIEVAGIFLKPGEVVLQVEERGGRSEIFRAAHDGRRFDWPMAVLVNRRSASAAEILAGALRDHGRALTLGERTFGKGSVQGVFSFRRGDGVRVTTARYLLPSGEAVDGTGFLPEREIETEEGAAAAGFLQSTHLRFMSADDFEETFGVRPEPDHVREAALEYLRERLRPAADLEDAG